MINYTTVSLVISYYLFIEQASQISLLGVNIVIIFYIPFRKSTVNST